MRDGSLLEIQTVVSATHPHGTESLKRFPGIIRKYPSLVAGYRANSDAF